jgi:hypothetical protein
MYSSSFKVRGRMRKRRTTDLEPPHIPVNRPEEGIKSEFGFFLILPNPHTSCNTLLCSQ